MPCLCAGWCKKPVLLVLPCSQPSARSGRGARSPPVSGMCCGAHLTQGISLEGQQVGRCCAFGFSWQCEGGLHLLGFSGSCLCRALCNQDPKMSISKLNSVKDSAKAFTPGFFLRRNSVFNFLLSLHLLAFSGCFSFHYHSTGVNFSGVQNRTHM